MIVLLLVLGGLVFGSFVNALVWRLHEGRDWVKERSECTHCHHELAPQDLVPVLSWLYLRGKCRYCHRPIQDSPLVELALPAAWLISYLYWPGPLQGLGLFAFIVWLIFLIGFLALAVYDLKWLLLPDVIVWPLVVLAFVQLAAGPVFFGGAWAAVADGLLGACTMSGLFLLIYLISKGNWIGFGDVKLALALGALAGGILPALLVLFVASLLGSFVALVLALQGKAGRKTQLPFGPLLIAGTVVVVLFGQRLIDWYSGFLIGA